MFDIDKSFWCDKEEEKVAMLQEDIPPTGKVTDPERPVLEEWRKLQNAYYRYYNDGDAFVSKLSSLFGKYEVERPVFYESDNYKEGKLEELADKVFAAALKEKAEMEKV